MLSGEFAGTEWTYLSLDFMRCNSDTRTNCAPIDEINKVIHGGVLGLFIIGLSVIPNNYQKSVKYFDKNVFTSFLVKDFREDWLYLKKTEVNTDVSIIQLHR